jgi:hypothetical protein
MRTTNGSVSAIKLIMNESPVVYDTLSSPFYGNKVDTNEFHKILGHCGSDTLENTAKINNSNLNGEFKISEQCAIAKARQKYFNKDLKGGSQVFGERSYLDIVNYSL